MRETASAGRRPPFLDDLGEVETVEDGLHLRPRNGRGVALQTEDQLARRGAGLGQQSQQHRDDHVRGQGCSRVAVTASLQLLGAELGVDREIDVDTGEQFAARASLAHSGQQEGLHRDVEHGARFLLGIASGRLAEQALDGSGQGAVARETHVTEPEQA